MRRDVCLAFFVRGIWRVGLCHPLVGGGWIKEEGKVAYGYGKTTRPKSLVGVGYGGEGGRLWGGGCGTLSQPSLFSSSVFNFL